MDKPRKRKLKRKHKRTGTNFKDVKIIKRNFGWYKRKHGIWLDPLLPIYQKLLIDNKFMKKYVDDEQTLRVIFNITDMEQQNKNHRKYWYNPHTDNITSYKLVIQESEKIDWKCAMCEAPIRSSMSDFSQYNFCCSKCGESLNKQTVDRLIVQSSLAFTKFCKRLLRAQQRMIKIYQKPSRR